MADDPAVSRELNAAEHEAERLSRLLADLLTLAREPTRTALQKPVLLAGAAAEAVERWQGTALSTGHALALAVSEPAAAWAAAEDVAIMFDNLIENALAYAPSGTDVSLEVGATETTAFVAVLDEGPGLAEGEQSLVFERFARGTAGATAPGTGLGLAIVRTLAEQWKGSATLTNRHPSGARAEVLLPAAALPTPKAELTIALPIEP
jgi:signal transduction histidine kinase